MKIKFITLGCKTNQYETNAMEQAFFNEGCDIAYDKSENADVYVINTCSVTNMAERKSRQMIRRAKELNKNAIIVACGCYAQVAKEELEKIPEIDLIVGVKEKNNIVEIVNKFLEDRQNSENVSDIMQETEYEDFGITTYTELNRAVIKIQDGCDRYCTYCIIPYARGKVRSRKPENIIKEIEEISKQGIKEVVLTGIHIASYGKDFENFKLIDLLEQMNKIENIKRIRLGSIEPKLITEEFVARLTKLEKICDHFHLSLQSGCDETLKRMNRRYTIEEFKNIVEILRKVYPDVSLTTDVIVGFPGETEEEFNATYEFLKDIKFYKMHVFKYSPRRGTPAEKMPNQVDASVKEARSKKLIELSNKNQTEYNKNKIGKNVDVLFEERENEYYKGHTSNYMMLKVKTEQELENQIKSVKIEATTDDGLELVGQI